MMMKANVVLLLAILAGPLSAAAQAAETGPMESRVGFVDKATGARVEAVEASGEMGEYRVLVSVPADGKGAATEIEEVVVRAERPAEQTPSKPPRYEVIRDYANDRYGFYIYMGTNQSLPFRIYFKDHSSAQIHNR